MNAFYLFTPKDVCFFSDLLGEYQLSFDYDHVLNDSVEKNEIFGK